MKIMKVLDIKRKNNLHQFKIEMKMMCKFNENSLRSKTKLKINKISR